MKTRTKLLAIAGAVCSAWAAVSYIAVRRSYKVMFPRWEPDDYSATMRYKDLPAPVKRREFGFFSGKNMLKGYLYGENNEKGLIVFSHGILSCHEDYLSGIIELVNRGWSVFAFNNTGSAGSEGKDARGLVQGALDLNAALEYIEEDPDLSKKKIFLYGHSQGGYSVCSVLNFKHDIAGVVSVSGFTTPFEVTAELGRYENGDIVRLAYPMIKLFDRVRFGRYAGLSAIKGINKSNVPVLIMHGVGDTYVNYHGAAIINNRNRIKNPRVMYMDLEYPERTGHNDIFLSLDAKHYNNEIDKRVDEAKTEYFVKDKYQLPSSVLDSIYEDVDRVRASEVNKELFESIDKYFTRLL